MTNPAKPKITFPLDRVPFVNAFSILANADHADPGVGFNAYILRRRLVSGTLGSYEYFSQAGSTWGGTTVTNVVSTFNPLASLSIGGFGFTSGNRYQLDIQLRDTNGGFSPNSDPIIVMPLPIGGAAVTQPGGAFTASRPRIAWNYTPAANNAKQVFWLAAAYEDSTSNVLWNSGYRYDPDKISCVIEADCKTGHNYYFGVTLYDENNLSIVSPIVGPFLCTLNLPAAPNVAFTPEYDTGTMLIEASSAFNLLSVDTADLITVGSIGDWQDVKNANSTYDNTIANIGLASLRITAAGKSYGFLDTESGTFGNEDTLYTDYNAEITSMEP
jgi:hypothetical protein